MSRRLLFVLMLGALAVSCRNVDPNKGTFSCEQASDCGSGYQCRPQFSGGGRCFADGLCQDEELCNGVDDTCDGQIDEAFPGKDSACTASRPGLCAAGKQVCTLGAVLCQSQVMASIERCNLLDDDCDGQTDEDFDLMSDADHCGACNRACPSGTRCRAATCVEARCDDSLDNDSNGKADCDDEVCFGFDCNSSVVPASRCGFAPVVRDSGVMDSGVMDSGVTDGGVMDGGVMDGGVDAGPIDGGFVRGCFRPEAVCDDGLDNDGDGVADCADPDCNAMRCSSSQVCAMGTCPGPG
ncbi:MAG: hypothetical protein IAE78_21095 [Myxococcus sp.]|nr:hypothetical protein [Myxococcus sp.]